MDKKWDGAILLSFTFALGTSTVPGMITVGVQIGVGRFSFIRLGACSVP